MKKGQITVYFALVFSLVLSLFLSVMESARAAGLRLYMECAMESALNSALAEYNRELLEHYDVFFLDLSYNGVTPSVEELSGRLSEYMMWNLSPGEDEHLLSMTDFYDVSGANASITGIRLASDERGDVFRNQAVHFIKQFIGLDELEGIRSWIRVKEEKEIDGEDFKAKAEQAKAEWDSYKADDIWEEKENGFFKKHHFVPMNDPIITMISFRNQSDLSKAKLDSSDVLSRRENAAGSKELAERGFDLTEELFFDEYIMTEYGNFSQPKEDTVLKYETEYIIYGLGKDYDNLAMVVQDFYLLRCAANLCSLYLDEEDTEMVKIISSGISAVTEIPEPVITAFIFILWAQAEGAMDIRDLLDGKRVPLIKDVKDFTVSLNGVKDFVTQKKDETGSGLSYADYLRILLVIKGSKVKTYRAMDLIEVNIRKWTGNEKFRMDACLDGMEALFSLESGYGYRYTARRSYYYLS